MLKIPAAQQFISFSNLCNQTERKHMVEVLYRQLIYNQDDSIDFDIFSDALNAIATDETIKSVSIGDAQISNEIITATISLLNNCEKAILKNNANFANTNKKLKVLKVQAQYSLSDLERLLKSDGYDIAQHYKDKLNEYLAQEKQLPNKILENSRQIDIAKALEQTSQKRATNLSELKEKDRQLRQELEEIPQLINNYREKILDDCISSLEDAKIADNLKIIDEQRAAFLKELYKKIDEFKKIKQLLSPFSLETGRLWDMSRGLWKNTGFDVLQKYANILENDKNLKELAELLGRFRSAEQETEEETFEDVLIKPEFKYNFAQQEEFIGVRESDDISNILPAELGLLATKDTESIFLKKFAEKKLQTWEYRAKYLSSKGDTFENKRNKSKEAKKGPFIICVDTSGSMNGTPEHVAKVICFAILKIAMQDKRKCYLISFSTQIETLDLTDIQNSLDKLVRFLSMSFHGGTDASPALEQAVKMLDTENYKKADILVVSDFIMPALDAELSNKINTAKINETQFHSLTIANSGNNNTINEFSHNWSYNPSNPNSLFELINLVKKIKK